MFLLVPAYPGCYGRTAVKWLLLLFGRHSSPACCGWSAGGGGVSAGGADEALVGGELAQLAREFRRPPSDQARPVDDDAAAAPADRTRPGLLTAAADLAAQQQVDPASSQVRTAAVGAPRACARQTPDEQLFAAHDARAASFEHLQHADGRPRPVAQRLLGHHLSLERCGTTTQSCLDHTRCIDGMR